MFMDQNVGQLQIAFFPKSGKGVHDRWFIMCNGDQCVHKLESYVIGGDK